MTTPELEQVARQSGPWVERGARFGAISRGVIYLVVGGLALRAAMGSQGEAVGPGGVFDTIMRQPLGRPLLALLAIGLAGYAVWDLVRAAVDANRGSATVAQVLQRIGWAIGGFLSGALAVTAFRAVIDLGRPGTDEQQAKGWAATILTAPFGAWILTLTGLVIVAVGLTFFWKGWHADLDADLRATPLRPAARRWILRFGRFGMLARGTVLTLIGGFLILAVIHLDPREAHGVAGALTALARQPYGRWLLGAVAAGFMSYGLYEMMRARYSRFTVF